MKSRYMVLAFFAVVLGAATALPSIAQKYPVKPIRLIVPLAPGGGSDIMARILAQKITESFGVPVVVDNRSGGGGTIGAEIAVRANPDGYTMILVSNTYAANAALYKLPYDALSDVAPITLIGATGYLVVLHPLIPVTTIGELIAYDRMSPGKLNYGSGGIGNSNHLVTELFNQMAGTRMTHVPYKGVGLAVNDLIGGQIQVIFGAMPGMLPHVKSNRVRGIAVTTAKRSGAVPDIPTVAETVTGYEAMGWVAVLGPASLPDHIIVRWSKELNRILSLPDVKARLASDSVEPVGGPPERFREVLKRDVAMYRKVVKFANIKPGT